MTAAWPTSWSWRSRRARLDGWDEHLRLDLWLEEAIAELGIDPHQRYLGTIPVDAALPWDHLDVGLEPGFLAQE
ncbi:MAG: hypothetical protein U1F43_25150 [Myxococcota bacterium]